MTRAKKPRKSKKEKKSSSEDEDEDDDAEDSCVDDVYGDDGNDEHLRA